MNNGFIISAHSLFLYRYFSPTEFLTGISVFDQVDKVIDVQEYQYIMLQGKLVNIRLVERDEVEYIHRWETDPDVTGPYEPIVQKTLSGFIKRYDERGDDGWFFIETKDGEKVGTIYHEPRDGFQTIGYYVLPSYRGKGYCTEAVRIIVDYLFLSKNIVRIQADTVEENEASRRVLLSNGFKREGSIRQSYYSRGRYRDLVLFSIIRDDWQTPRYSW